MTAWIALAWAATAGPALSLSGTLAWMRLRTRRASETDDLNPSTFSMARYQPMERLLCEEEFQFLTRMPGYRPEMGRKWKRDRRRLFRLYLNELGYDFEALHRDARGFVVGEGSPSASLIGVLFKQKVAFWRAMAAIDVRLTLDSVGVGTVDVRPLLQLVQAMQAELAQAAQHRIAPAIG